MHCGGKVVQLWLVYVIGLYFQLEGCCSRPGLCRGPAEGNTPISRGK